MPSAASNHVSVVIIGGGHAGLSVSHCLKDRGITDHLILEKNRVAHSWGEERWDTFCLVTPNHQCSLPGYRYKGSDPEGFMVKDEIVAFLEGYVRDFRPPIREGVEVFSVTRNDGCFELDTNQGTWRCDGVVVAIGAFHTPIVPEGADRIPSDIMQIHSADYRNPGQIPAGETVIVGNGQSGCQIMEDLHLAGRKVHLCLGDAPRSPRSYRGKDAVTWLEEMGYYKTTIAEHPDKDNALKRTNHYVTGRNGGREIDLRDFAARGARLYGYVEEIEAGRFIVSQDVAEKLDSADASYNGICQRIDDYIAANQIEAPEQSHYSPVWRPVEEPAELGFAENNVTSVIWSIGYRPDFQFVKLPVFNERGFPETDRGLTKIPGLYFLGLPWQHTWGSARFSGIAEDAEFLASRVSESLAALPDT
jgi:putative flavoprotein involved in K+ transport